MPYAENPFDVPATQYGSADVEDENNRVANLLRDLLEALNDVATDKQRPPIGFAHPTTKPKPRRRTRKK